MKENDSVATLLEPVVRQEATRKALISQLNDLNEQLKAAAVMMDEEAEMAVTLAEELENLSSDHDKLKAELAHHSDAAIQIKQRSSDMNAAILAMRSQIEVKEARMKESKQADEAALAQIKKNFTKNASFFNVMSTWSEEEKSDLKEVLQVLGEDMEIGIEDGTAVNSEVENLLTKQSASLTEQFEG